MARYSQEMEKLLIRPDILATGFLRHYCIALQAMLGENLNTIKTRDQG